MEESANAIYSIAISVKKDKLCTYLLKNRLIPLKNCRHQKDLLYNMLRSGVDYEYI